jgi:hypothetical protein
MEMAGAARITKTGDYSHLVPNYGMLQSSEGITKVFQGIFLSYE